MESNGKLLNEFIVDYFRNYNEIWSIRWIIQNMKWKTLICCLKNLTYRLLLNMCMYNFLKLEAEKLCLWTYLLENNQVRQFVKFKISST